VATDLTDAAVPGVVAELGLPGIVDVHVHFMPDRLLRKVWQYFDEAGPLVGRRWPITYRGDDDDRLAVLRALGVRAFPALSYPHRPGMAQWLNDWAGQFAAATPDNVASGTFFPEPGAADYVAAAIEGGARIFKAHVQVGQYDPRDPLLDPVWGVLVEAAIPVVVHCGNGPVPGRHTGAEPFAQVLARHPRLVAVVAHLGMPEYTAFLDLAERYPGVHLDTTMAFTDFTEAQAPFPRHERSRLESLGLEGRVLYGSDFPNIPYPFAHQVESLVRLDLGEEWLRAVLWDNGARLLGVPR
jgi:predicted TIM-barrel fold metal-dependent hydrolase